MTFKQTSFVIAMLAAGLSGCASLPMAPLSYLDGNPPGIRVDSTLAPVQILSVDGRIYRSGPVQVAPGTHSVVLASGGGPNPNRQVSMLVEPCTRYFLAAQRESVTSRTWEMKVASTEPVAGCDPAEERKKAGV
jgi:hypothetical protein